jgi:hypothetical protein
MGFSGTLDDVALVDVLQVLGVTTQTGVLVVRRGSSRAEVEFDAGRVLTVQLYPPRRHLASTFLERGWIDFETLHDALVRQSTADRHQLLGQILVERGALTREQLLQGLRGHVRDTVVSLLRWDRGSYEFREQAATADVPRGDGRRLGVGLDADELARLVAEARARSDEEPLDPPPDTASWPVRARLAIALVPDVLVRHGLETSLQAEAFSLVHVTRLEDVTGALLAGEDQHPTLVVDVDPLIGSLREAQATGDALGELQRRWPNFSVVSFGRVQSSALYELLRATEFAFHVPRPSREAEADLATLRDFIETLAATVARVHRAATLRSGRLRAHAVDAAPGPE